LGAIYLMNRFITLIKIFGLKHNTVTPYGEASGEKKKQINSMFDSIAPYYDFLNRFLSLGIDTIWRKKAIRQLQAAQPKVVLDVATGTADLAIEIHKQLDKVEKIVGLDISAEMLEVGRKKIHKKELDNVITLQQGDSENLPFEDNTFDAITVAFGVRNFENLEKGLNEMRRVLKDDGQLVVLEFSKPQIFPFKQLFNFLTSKDPRAYKYLYESVQKFPDGSKFVDVLERTGFKSNKCVPLSLGICSIYTGAK